MSEDSFSPSHGDDTLDPESQGVGLPPKTQPDSEAVLAPSGTLGPYEIRGELGRGGMGVVYDAFHPGLKRAVALKVLIAGEDASDEAIARFHREAEAVAKLGHHPGIVPVYDIGAEGNRHYFAMHQVEGKPLDRLIDEGEVTPKRAAGLAMKIARALDHAHSHGVLHRDVKPGNILVNQIGDPQLTDFGLAKDVESEASMTRSGVTLGTPHYMPPEQADGRISAVDARSDVYSAGATLFEMLVMRPPFEGDSVTEILRKVLLVDPPSPRKANPAVDRDLATICLKCLEKTPDRRYATAGALADDLERYIQGQPILARPVSLFERTARRLRRNPLAAGALVALLVVVAAGGIVGAWGLNRYMTERRASRDREGRADARARAEAVKRAEIEQRADKARRVTRALLLCEKKLGPVQQRLNRNFLDSRRRDGQRQEAFASLAEPLSELEASLAADPAQKATFLAMRGWLHWLAVQPEKADRDFLAARETDPEVAWGFIFEALTYLHMYVHRQRLPVVSYSSGKLAFGKTPPETDEMKGIRDKAQTLLAAARGAVWGEGTENLGAVTSDLAHMQEGDLNRALSGLTRALAVPELSWLEDQLRYTRARLRFLARDVEGGMKDIEAFRTRHPNNVDGLFLLGELRMAAGYAAQARGESPLDDFRRAEEAYDGALKIGKTALLYNCRGLARSRQGLALRDRREGDPRPLFRKAIEDHHRAMDLDPDNNHGPANTASAYRELGQSEETHGQDPRPTLQKSLLLYDRLVEARPGRIVYVHRRAQVHARLAQWLSGRGLDPGDHFRRAEEGFAWALEHGTEGAEYDLELAQMYKTWGLWVQNSGRDPTPLFEKASALLDARLEKEPTHGTALRNRGALLGQIGEYAYRCGRNPTESFDRSLALLEQAHQLLPEDLDVRHELGLALGRMALSDQRSGKDPQPRAKEALRHLHASAAQPSLAGSAHYNRGLILERIADWQREHRQDSRPTREQSLGAFEAALERLPGNVSVMASLGRSLMFRARDEAQSRADPTASSSRAVALLSKVIDLLPGHPDVRLDRAEAFLIRAQAHVERGGSPVEDFTACRADLEKILADRPGHSEASFLLGGLLLRMGQQASAKGDDARDVFARAATAYRSAFDHPDKGIAARNNTVQCLIFAGLEDHKRGIDPSARFEAALGACEGVLARQPDNAIALFNRGSVNQHWAAALRDFAVDPSERFEAALDAYLEATKKAPGLWQAAYNRAILLEEFDRFEEAVRSYELADRVLRGRYRVLGQRLGRAKKLAAQPAWARRLIAASRLTRMEANAEAARAFEEGLEKAKAAGMLDSDDFKVHARDNHYNLACIYGRLAAGWKAKHARGDPPADAEILKGKALAQLREAVRFGLSDREPLDKDEDLAPLRGMPEFEALLKE